MKISNLYKVGIKGNNRAKKIEDYLEREIVEIVDKKRFYEEDDNIGVNRPYYGSDSLQAKLKRTTTGGNRYGEENRNRHIKEDYLPFNKEEIRPIIKDSIDSGRIEELIIKNIMPEIESWLDENLERIAQRVIKRYIAKQIVMQEQETEDKEESYDSRYSKRANPRYDR